jgi:TRAP-type mannitol/chloroaromatic compound transport system permease small subunit
MEKFSEIISNSVEFIGKALMWFGWAIAGIIMWEIALRVIFNRPTVWAHELSIMIFGALSMMAGSYTHKYRGHVNMDLFYGRLTPKKKAIWDAITFPFFSIFCAILLWKGWSMAWRAIITWELSQSTWAPILWPIKITIPIGAAFLFFQGLINFISDIRKAFREK